MYGSISAGPASIKKQLDVFSEAPSTYDASKYKLLCIAIELVTLQMLKQLRWKRPILVVEAGLAEIDLYTKFPTEIRKGDFSETQGTTETYRVAQKQRKWSVFYYS